MFGLIIPLLLIFFCGYVIWRAGDTFLEGSNYIGRKTSRGTRGGSYTFRTYGEMYDDKGKFIIKKAK